MIYGQPVTFGGASGEIDITDNGTFDVKKYATAKINVQSAPELLWTNASPNSQFAPQTVSVNGADYNAYLIEIKWAYSGGYTGIGYVPIGGTKCTIATHNNGSGALDSSALRAVESASKSGITFGSGANGAARVEGYNYGVPLRIWGVKFTL